MSRENVKRYIDLVKTDQALQAKLVSLSREQLADPSVLVKYGADSGYEFTTEDVRAFVQERVSQLQQDGELNESQLEAVAGGGKNDWVSFSIGTIGVACALSGIYNEVESTYCVLDK